VGCRTRWTQHRIHSRGRPPSGATREADGPSVPVSDAPLADATVILDGRAGLLSHKSIYSGSGGAQATGSQGDRGLISAGRNRYVLIRIRPTFLRGRSGRDPQVAYGVVSIPCDSLHRIGCHRGTNDDSSHPRLLWTWECRGGLSGSFRSADDFSNRIDP
jgi:hypothetical protein